MVSISFLYPMYLIFLLLIPLFIFIHLVTLKATKTTALRFANFEAISKIKGVDFFSKNIIILLLSILIVFLLVMSVSGLRIHATIQATEYSFIIALDTSQSMEAEDVFPNRMGAAKGAAVDFIKGAPITTRAGVVSFSGNAYIEQDLTDNKNLVKTAIDNVQISDISGTDIYEAVITSSNLLRSEESRAIILLSDGQINVGSIGDAIDYANENNVIVHTIVVGTEEGGKTSYGVSKADEDSLKSLAYNTDGVFSSATDEAELLNAFNNAMEKTAKKTAINVSTYLLIVAILLFGLQYFLISSRYRRLV